MHLKLTLSYPANFTLLSVDLEFQSVLDKFIQRLYYPFACFVAAYKNITVVCVTNKAVSPALQLLIQPVQYCV